MAIARIETPFRKVTPIAVFVSVTGAFGITAPDWSRTVPLTAAVLACGQAGVTNKLPAKRQAASVSLRLRIRILARSVSVSVSLWRRRAVVKG